MEPSRKPAGRTRTPTLRSTIRRLVWTAALILAASDAAAEEQSGAAAPSAPPGSVAVAVPPEYDGPPPPLAPEVINRSADLTRATIRAVRLTAPLKIDGSLDEETYRTVPSISDFIQQEPQEGAAATEKTEIWIFYDRDNFYLSARCWDSHPERMIATEMRRDGPRIPRNEDLAFGLDPYFDHRNGFNFEFTPVGGMMDAQIANDGGTIDLNWNSVLEHGTARFEQGWSVEVRIPFRTLRYRSGAAQVWGLQVRRMVRWKNELDYITRIPASVGERGHMRLSLAPAVVGLEVPPPAKNIEIKPYAISSLSTDRTVVPNITNDGSADWGGDVKYGVTNSLTADFTYNTDFAQVEADLQQVNLTRFSLFFPEKREFFLENSGTFRFANVTGTNSLGTDPTPQLFYSRQIGLVGSTAVPIIGGGRLSGRTGRYTIGLLNIVSDEATISSLPRREVPITNFSVVRVRRDVLRRSYIGAMFTGRSATQTGSSSNEAYGLDATFNLKTNISMIGYFARSHSGAVSGDDGSYKASFDYEGDRYGALADYTTVDKNFNPGVGFVPRPDMRRSFGVFRFSPRPANRRSRIRKYYYNATADYIMTTSGRVDNETYTGEFALDFQNSDRANIKYSNFYEFLPATLPLGPGVAVPPGSYDYQSVLAGYNFGPQRLRFAANTSLEYGSYRDGHKTSALVSGAAINLPPHLIVEPSYTFNYIVIPQGTLNQHLIAPRITYGITPRAFVSALVQFNTTLDTLSSNVRLRWEYRPGSELFVVWNEQHDSDTPGLPLQNRALIVKMNHLWRY
jgi:hypothetical protein